MYSIRFAIYANTGFTNNVFYGGYLSTVDMVALNKTIWPVKMTALLSMMKDLVGFVTLFVQLSCVLYL